MEAVALTSRRQGGWKRLIREDEHCRRVIVEALLGVDFLQNGVARLQGAGRAAESADVEGCRDVPLLLVAVDMEAVVGAAVQLRDQVARGGERL